MDASFMPQVDHLAPVLIYRDHILRYSEIWVRLQGESLRDFRAYYAGSKRIHHLDTPADRTFVINGGGLVGRAAEAAFKATGRSPRLERWARSIRPVLVHAHFGLDGVLLRQFARRLGVPLVTTFHGYDVMTYDSYASRAFYLHRKFVRERKLLARDGALFIAVSKYIRGLLLDLGFPDSRIAVHYIGVDVRFFTPDPAIPREPIVLFVARLEPQKGCDYLIRAMAEVQKAYPEAELVVIGEGCERAALEAHAREVLRRFRFLGIRSQDEIKAWLNRAMVFAVPSLRIESGHGEAFGLVFAEAQAMGVPVVSFASGGVPEAVAHGRTGFLSPERDWRGLAESIARLLSDPQLWTSMSRAGRQRTRELFDLAAQTRLLEDLYRTALREPAGRMSNPQPAFHHT
ncbi:MAG TPA: glycosyltransferase [Alphaproteobacteria bacterium]